MKKVPEKKIQALFIIAFQYFRLQIACFILQVPNLNYDFMNKNWRNGSKLVEKHFVPIIKHPCKFSC